MERIEYNFVAKGTDTRDVALFFGPFRDKDHEDGEDRFNELEPHWTLANVAVAVGLFKSTGQARKNGWDGPIPRGFSDFRHVGKKCVRITVLDMGHMPWTG